MPSTKKERMLEIFFRALRGDDLSVRALSSEYDVSSKSITRDLNEIKFFLAEHRSITGNTELEYSYPENVYRLNMDEFLSEKELFALLKVIIGARAFSKNDLLKISEKLKHFSSPSERKNLIVLIRNELIRYHEVKHDCDSVLDTLWSLSRAITEHREITITYYKMNRNRVEHRICPLSLMFSEYYFYLIAFKSQDDKRSPIFFRVDRISSLVRHRCEFPLNTEFDEGALREQCQFMLPGELNTVLFEFSGPSVQAVLDRLPNAEIAERTSDGKYLIQTKVYGDGLKMYLLSQGAWVKVIAPESFALEMREEANKMLLLYS